MLKNFRIFQNRTARQTFIVLVMTFILGTFFAFFIARGFTAIRYHNDIIKGKYNRIIKILNVSHKLPIHVLPRYIRSSNHPGFRVFLDQNADKNVPALKNMNETQLRNWINAHPKVTHFAVQLDEGRWLNFRFTFPRHVNWLLTILIVSSSLTILVILLMITWSIKRLSLPLSQFAIAAKQFGLDLNAPPIAETGSNELREVIHAFNEMQARIRRLITDRTQMLAAISHDLRTPITRLKLRAEFLEDSTHYQSILEDLNEMENMIASILVFAKENFQDEPMEHFDINALLESLCNEMADTGFQVNFQSPNERIPFFGKMNALKRAFTNLLDNAIKYGKSVNVQLEKNENQLSIRFEDKGPGIPATDLLKVFEPFYRVDPSRSKSTGSTGLGLAITRDIIRAHGGDITLTNLPQGGLRVEVTLSINL